MVRSRLSSRLRLSPGNAVFLTLTCLAAILFPQDSSGVWPFTSPKEAYIAKVGDEIITTNELLEAISNLHKSSRAGKALAEQQSFAKQDFGKFLNELIDNKLMVIEAVNLGLDKEPDFLNVLNNYRLNLFLDRLRQDEILNKIKVEDKEIEDYYQEQLKKKEEEKKAQEEAATSENKLKEEAEVADKKEEPKKMTPEDREAIRKGFFNQKAAIREKEYFSQIRQKAEVKVNNDILSSLSADKTELWDKAVASVNGESILGRDVVGNLDAAKAQDEDAKKGVVERLILYTILDQEAMSRGYENEEVMKTKVKKYREQTLIDQFKRKTILPAIKVDEKEIVDYYNANKEKYREPDRVSLMMIHLMNEEEAQAIVDDLKKGADFSYFAREKSIDPSKEKGGDIGWVGVNRLTNDIQKAIHGAKEGDILGPFSVQSGYAVLEFRGLEKGDYVPVDKVKDEIDTTIGRDRFNATLSVYIKRLRDTIPIKIDQKQLDKIQGR